MFHCSRKFSAGTTQKRHVPFTFQPDFPETFVNGKHATIAYLGTSPYAGRRIYLAFLFFFTWHTFIKQRFNWTLIIQVNKIQFKETARVPLVLEWYRRRRNNHCESRSSSVHLMWADWKRKFKLTKSLIQQQILSYLVGVDTFRGKKWWPRQLLFMVITAALIVKYYFPKQICR